MCGGGRIPTSTKADSGVAPVGEFLFSLHGVAHNLRSRDPLLISFFFPFAPLKWLLDQVGRFKHWVSCKIGDFLVFLDFNSVLYICLQRFGERELYQVG